MFTHFNLDFMKVPSQSSNSKDPVGKSILNSQTKIKTRRDTITSVTESLLQKMESNNSGISENSAVLLRPFMRREVQLIKTILLIILMFCVSWLPYAFISMCGQFVGVYDLTKILTPTTAFLASIFAKTSSIYNPILYTFMNRQFKAYLKAKYLRKKRLTRSSRANKTNKNKSKPANFDKKNSFSLNMSNKIK
jgi:hypothetical protein